MGKASRKKAGRKASSDPRPTVEQVREAEAALIPPEYSSAANEGSAGAGQPRPVAWGGPQMPEEERAIGIPVSPENARGLAVHGTGQDLSAVAERLTETHPGLAAKLGQGLTRDELQQLGPEIARAMHAAGAGPGAYTFTDQGSAGPVPGKVILGGKRDDDGGEGLPAGMEPGDIIAAEQPLGYVETGIELPDGASIESGAKVYRVAPAEAERIQAGQRERRSEVFQSTMNALADEKRRFRGSEHGYRGGVIGAAPEQALEAAGRHRHGPEIVVTDDLDALGDTDLVIEDTAPGEPGRLLIGSPEQVRRYHDRERALDARMTARFGQHGRRAVTTEAEADLIRLRTGWDADTVLGHHAWLSRHYRNPGPELADYLAFIMRDQTNESFLSAGIFWPVNLSHGPADVAEGRQLAQIISRGLGDAGTFQVTRGMCEDMRQAWEASDVRADPLPLSEGELPVPAGFCWLDKPWMIREDEGHWLPVRAVSWERTLILTSGETMSGMADGVRMCAWLAIEDTVAFGHWEDEAHAARTATWLGQVVLHRVVLLPFDFGSEINRAHTALTGMLGLLHILWMYLGTELPRSRPVTAQAPAVRRRAQRSLNHTDITIITLRKYDYIGDRPAGFPKVVSWSCRWWVDKFFRHIDSYDDTDADGRRRRHKPVPALRTGTVPDDDHDICAVCLANGQSVRITEVHGFFKGPADKPLRTPSRERTLSKLSR